MHRSSRSVWSISQVTVLLVVLLMALFCAGQSSGKPGLTLAVRGDVATPLQLTLKDLNAFPQFQIEKVSLLNEKKNPADPEVLDGVSTYRGVLLRDLLNKATIIHERKWEPSVFVRVRDANGKEDVFSFGEIFYSSVGRSILIATEKDGKPIAASAGIGQLIVSTDLRGGRWMTGVTEIQVARVNVEMKAYDDLSKQVVRPPSQSVSLKGLSEGGQIRLADLQALPPVHIPAAVMVGDCEGLRGVYSFKGPQLRDLLSARGVTWSPAVSGKFVLACSEDGFCATFSFGELFNSRLENNIVIAFEKDGKILADDGFARSVVPEDSTGGRSVRRISYIEVR